MSVSKRFMISSGQSGNYWLQLFLEKLYIFLIFQIKSPTLFLQEVVLIYICGIHKNTPTFLFRAREEERRTLQFGPFEKILALMLIMQHPNNEGPSIHAWSEHSHPWSLLWGRFFISIYCYGKHISYQTFLTSFVVLCTLSKRKYI